VNGGEDYVLRRNRRDCRLVAAGSSNGRERRSERRRSADATVAGSTMRGVPMLGRCGRHRRLGGARLAQIRANRRHPRHLRLGKRRGDEARDEREKRDDAYAALA